MVIFAHVMFKENHLFLFVGFTNVLGQRLSDVIGPLNDLVTWCNITQVVQAGQGEQVRVALFWKSHWATCVPACVILYHVTGSYKGLIDR